jgi:RNA polymerase sigma-70 factor (ECF subfamily)
LSKEGVSSVAQDVLDRAPLAARSAPCRQAPAAVDPDRELVLRWQAGELSCFEILVRRHQERVFRLLYRMLGSAEEAEDVAQETFLNLHRHGRRFRHESRFSTFVYRVAANAALNHRRSLGRERGRLTLLRSQEEKPAAGAADPERGVLRREVEQSVHEALLRLPERLRLPLVLFDLEGLPYAEIATVSGLPEGTVKSRIHRARRALRDQLRSRARLGKAAR